MSPRKRGDARRLLGVGTVVAEEMRVVLDRGAAARRGGEDGVEPFAFDLVDPRVDVGAREVPRLARPAHVMDERAAAAFALGEDHFDAEAAQEPHRGDVDAGIEHGLRAAVQKRDAGALRALRREAHAGPDRRARRELRRRQPEHRLEPLAGDAESSGERQNTAREPGEPERQAEAAAIGKHGGEQPADEPVEKGPAIGLLDAHARLVDEAHVVHARGAGGHAGEAGEAAVDVRRHLLRCRLVVLQHVLDQVDSSARRIELVAEFQIGRAGGEAEAAMHAAPQDLIRFLDVGIGELLERERGLHLQTPAVIRPGFRMPRGSNWSLSRRDSAASAAGCGSKGGTAARSAELPRISVAWPPPAAATAMRISRASPSFLSASTSIQTSPPDQS